MTLVQNRQQLLSGSKIILSLTLMLFISSCGLFNQTRDKEKDKVITDKTEAVLDTLDITLIPDSELKPIKKDSEPIKIEDDYSAFRKDSYKIGMLIPFSANDVNFDANDDSDQKFVNYYAGVKLALEQFKDAGHKFEVQIIDSERSLATVEAKLNSGILSDADVIVGPYNRDALSVTAEYGKKMKSAVISPWLSSTRITDDNPYYIQLRPSLSSHYFKMINHANQNFSVDEIVLVGRDNNADKNRFKYFQSTFAAVNDFGLDGRLKEYLVSSDSLSYAEFAFSDVFAGKEKVAIMLPNWNYNDEDFIYSVLRRLNIERGNTEVYVYGMPIIFDSEKIDFEFYNNLKIRMCLSEFIEWEEERVKTFMRNFYDAYGAIPTSDAFEGYDMMNFISANLLKYGVNFQFYLEQDRNRYLQTAYDIQKIYDEEDEQFENIKYLENRHLDLIQLQGNKFVKID